MDLILFFPVGEIKRNIVRNRAAYISLLDRALGTSEWQSGVRSEGDVTKLIRIFERQLRGLGYTPGQVRTAPIKNEKNVAIYHLVFASKHKRGNAIWQSITARTPTGQKLLFWATDN